MDRVTVIRHKGRDYTVSFYNVERNGEVLHRIQIVTSPKGRNVRIYLDDRELT
jgi:hypothetical protein